MNKRLFPVLHLHDEKQALANAQLVVDANVDGLFLIHHNGRYPKLMDLARKIQEKFPDLWIGVNALDKEPEELIPILPGFIKGVWVDNGGVIEEDGFIKARRAYEISILKRKRQRFEALEYFGGFAFKYQKPVTKLEEGARYASLYSDVVVTSGDGTGQPADIEKIRRIRKGTTGRLGIASGITPENFKDYEPYVDDYLVATGISYDEHNFDSTRLGYLKDKIYESNYNGASCPKTRKL